MVKEGYRGVEYYKGPDLAKGYMLDKAKEVYEELVIGHTIENINEAIELYNIIKYVKDDTFLLYLGEDKEEWLKEKNGIANSLVGKYINQHSDILAEYEEVDFEYKESFWEIIEKRKLSDITESRFKMFLDKLDVFAWQIFKQYKLVMKYDVELREYMLINPEGSTNLLLDKYLLKHRSEREESYLPQSLTTEDKEQIISTYIDLDKPNLNYTRLLSNVQNTKEFALDTRVKLKAKRVSERLERELFKDGSGRGTEIIVELKENVEGTVKQHFTLSKVGTEVDKEWLESNLDNPTLLNNFIYIFEFVNNDMVSKFPYNEIYASVFERFGFGHEKEYKTCTAFSIRETLSLAQMHVYYSFLKSKNKDLEAIIEWFFNVYLKEEFYIEDFTIKLPPIDNPNFEKCKSIFPTIESIIKKYRFYLEDGYIDEELVQMESKPLPFSECPSMTKDRYVYIAPNNDEARILRSIMFSDQSNITYFPNYGDSQYNTLIERLDTDKLYLHDIEVYQKSSLDWLVENDYVTVNDDNEVVLVNRNRTLIYYYIHINGVVVTSKLSNALKKEVDKLLNERALVSENTLLTRQESDYIDYYLNKRNFINGHDLRNKYLHGTSSGYENENEHYVNYLHALRLLITIMIKINDDLCTAKVVGD
ncbi:MULTISPECIES: hypothetical protein [Bacillus amyloliquefaciens group]|uniref:hypothetical protein n=1 Tax=Bacillus amyloliquefaciens group TaxID=1938374 RepID=UPI00077D8200|nr:MULTISPECIES: hypothetical protein [Bacillus amyloliquefaciens group]AMQ75626.1 hypothetical protein BAMY6614_03100 [Bacillus amyloliquefaciens UMAF6614]AWM49904.1 hypothetical protein DDT09_19440 [Bacillus amyloliquefaciens]MBF6666493.1 hypothetical protein [Bacillus velezensis]MDH3124357.1 hypothetical protein [Bacillus velezensis]QOE04152.1 hypothetical protein BAMOH1_18730 [Bacillus amyloliquefaciens]